ncbi:hypothetical protein ACLQ2S_13200 [Micromonospora sp. DT48]|uniref:hypothetical protein n=1 Tax=unclassified Micromonospora TaxID=2617518 RepID=UPI0012BCF18E|nr:hypothetical protein [Micromonospora sp. CP22]MTK05239.1 hypothetical protein [Micromonospora sp. CP22]
MAFIFIALVLLALAWPVVAVGAVALVAMAAFTLRERRLSRNSSGALTRASWLLTMGTALTGIAAYGHGLAATTFGLITDVDDRCALRQVAGYDHHRGVPAGGSHSMWPLQDTTCGPDLVPGFVNPLVASSAALFVALAVFSTVMSLRSR